MVNNVLKVIVKLAVVVIVIRYIFTQLPYISIDPSLVLGIVFPLFALALVKQWFPFIFNFVKRICISILRTTIGWLYKKPEKHGGAKIRPTRMRWRP